MYANMTHIQISYDSGYIKENTPGTSLVGFLIMMEIPRLMNGFEKSITRSRSDVMVNGAIAMSASCGERKKDKTHLKAINNDKYECKSYFFRYLIGLNTSRSMVKMN